MLSQLLFSLPSKERKSVDTDLLRTVTATSEMEQFKQTPTPVALNIPASPYKAPTLHKEGDIEIFVQQFENVAEENCCKEMKIPLQLHVRESPEGFAQI